MSVVSIRTCPLLLIFLPFQANGKQIPNSVIAAAAARAHISLRTGCMCNPGGAAALLQLRPMMASLSLCGQNKCTGHTVEGEHESDDDRRARGVTLDAIEAREGRELGVVRI